MILVKFLVYYVYLGYKYFYVNKVMVEVVKMVNDIIFVDFFVEYLCYMINVEKE